MHHMYFHMPLLNVVTSILQTDTAISFISLDYPYVVLGTQ